MMTSGKPAYRSTTLFDAKGYRLERSILDPAATAKARNLLLAGKDRLHRLLEQWTGEPIPDTATFARHQLRIPEYTARNLPVDLRHYLVGEFDLETRLDRRICGVLATAEVREALTRFWGTSKYYIHYPPMVRFKMSDVPGSILPAHQDFTYNTHLRDFITVWVPLVDIDDQVGGIILYDGSHLDGSWEHAPSGPWAHGLAKHQALPYVKHHVLMKVGDALLFPPLLIHESALHRSPTARYSIDFRVFAAPEDTNKSYFDPFEDRIVRRN
jgi:ectoine hydroxylase-related dioxygenase (phytanoyl-CoA dioxygenase family)